MEESKKEKLIRVFFIFFFAGIALLGFFLKYYAYPNSTFKKMAIVLKESSGSNADPLVVIYEIKDNKHFLVLFKIDVSDSYKFRALKSIEVDHPIEKLGKDNETGFWAKIDGNWLYFSNKLEQKPRPISYKSEMKSGTFKEKEAGGQKSIILDGMEIPWTSGDKVMEAHSISIDRNLWMIVTEKEVQVLKLDAPKNHS